jgi:hypothetical protein
MSFALSVSHHWINQVGPHGCRDGENCRHAAIRKAAPHVFTLSAARRKLNAWERALGRSLDESIRYAAATAGALTFRLEDTPALRRTSSEVTAGSSAIGVPPVATRSRRVQQGHVPHWEPPDPGHSSGFRRKRRG